MTSANPAYLFICSINRNRSKTGEKVCKQLAKAKGKNVQCESAGVSPNANRCVTKEIADKADKIFVMEEYMRDILEKEFNQPSDKIICLNIADMYLYQDPKLEAIIRAKIEPCI